MKHLLVIGIGAALLSVFPSAAVARVYDSYAECGQAVQDGVSNEVADFCRNCIQDGGAWTYPASGSDYGECAIPEDTLSDSDAQYLDYVKRNFTKTSTTCNFDDNDTCPGDSVCAESSPGQGFCYEPKEDRLINLLSVNTVQELITKVLQLLVQIGSVLLIFALVLTGFSFVAAQGNAEEVTAAKKRLQWVVIGGILLLAAEALALVLEAAIKSL